MFLGHFGVGFGAKAIAPRTSLGSLFLAAQLIDLLWPTFLLAGVERVRIVPGWTRVTPLEFVHYPISHSLLAVFGWAAMVAVVYALIRRYRRGATVLALAVVSHWLLDAVVHRPDLPLYPGGRYRLGLGLWSSIAGTLAVEVPLFLLGVWLYLRSTEASDRVGRRAAWGLVGFLAVIYAANLSGSPPPSVFALAWVGQAQWILISWGYWLDRHRPAMMDESGQVKIFQFQLFKAPS